MNAEPHEHKVILTRNYAALDEGCHIVRYGDTRVRVHRGPLLERRLLRGIRRAIRKHDIGSVRAGDKAALKERVLARAPRSEWVQLSDGTSDAKR